MDDPDKLNDRTTYRRCFACGERNEQGLKLVFRREGTRIYADFTPSPHHQGFPGLLHGGIIATLLDETLGRTGCLLYTSPSPRDLSTSRMPSSA